MEYKKVAFVKASLSGTIIEATNQLKLSDVGEASARRRRDLNLSIPFQNCFFLCFYLSLKIFPTFFLFFKISRNFSNAPDLEDCSNDSDKGRRRCSAFSLAVPLVVDPPTGRKSQKSPKSSDDLQISDLKSIDLQFSRSVLQQNPNEFSPWLSLMARALPLGLSVAPWPVETSTAHGDSSLWETVISSGIVMSFWYFLSASENDLSLVPPSLQPPEKRASHQLSLTSPVSRRLYRPPESTKTNLGFLLAGLNPNFGPLTLLKPMSIRCNPNLQSLNLRSVSTLLLYFCSQWLDRFYDLNGMGHHLRDKSLSLLWIYIHYLRTLTLVSPKALIIVSKSLKSYRFVFMNHVCRRFVCGHGGPWFNFYSATSLSNVFNHWPNTIIFKTRILCSQDKYALHMSDPEPLLYFIKRPSSDYKSIVFRTRADTLLRVDLLKPTGSSAVALSSTSPCLLTVTILSSIDSFVEDPSTNRDLTCAKSLSCICLKALMEPLLICFIYLFVALGNALLYVLNFGFLIPLSFVFGSFLIE